MKQRIAFLTAACMSPDHPGRRVDYWEHDLEFVPMREACADRGMELIALVWDDPALVTEDFDAFVIGTTWDYMERPEAFLNTLERIAEVRPLFNPPSVVRWNARKTYLIDLQQRGVPIVETLWRDRADLESIESAYVELGVDEVVVKPQVGAGAWRQVRVNKGDALPPKDALPPDAALVQPFLPSAISEGEYSFIFFDRVFSHCALKKPQPGDYRVQSIYGGRESVYDPTPDEIETARLALDAVDGDLLYARVDMMRDRNDRLALMELELIEPYLYPEQGPNMGKAFADALKRYVNHPNQNR